VEQEEELDDDDDFGILTGDGGSPSQQQDDSNCATPNRVTQLLFERLLRKESLSSSQALLSNNGRADGLVAFNRCHPNNTLKWWVNERIKKAYMSLSPSVDLGFFGDGAFPGAGGL
jgi:hypothetical protein